MDRKIRKAQELETTTLAKVKAVRDDLQRIEADLALNQKRQEDVRQGNSDNIA